ncbi:unnamed protein product [Closterium sp. NIES-53]
MWIFRVKRPPGSLPVFKARYVSCGFSQRQGVDFFPTFSPTLKMTTLQVLLHVATQRDYELHSLDYSTSFLQGSLHEEIWLRRPPSFTGSFPAGTLWNLRRPVYGLRQAPREWHDTLRTTLATLGFAPSTADPSLFLRTDTTLPPFYVLVYVDDLVFATADTEALAHVNSELQKRHMCTDLGELTSYLGLRITRDRAQRTITLTHSHMVQQILQRFGFTYSSPQSTPLPTSHSLSAPPVDESVEPSGPYPELVGCLMYLMTCTRPDLAYPLSLLARYVAPGRHRKVHWDAAKRVLRYLCSTSGMGLVLGGRARVVLTGHTDASWVDDLATQRSSQGYTFSLGSGTDSWRSTRSSSLRWLTYLLTDLGEAPRSPPVLYVDNKAMLALCQEHRLEHRTKHIALRYFLAPELQHRGQLCLAYVASQANTANVFTKALQPCDHQRFCIVLGHKSPSDWTPSKARNHEGNVHTASGDADDSRESIVLMAGDGTNTPSDACFLDTGATQHMTHSASFLTNVGAPRDVTRVVFGNDKSLPVVGVGSTRLIVDGGPVDITNVLHVPGLKVNLLSVTQLAKKGVKVTFDNAKMNLFWKGMQFAQGVLNGELYQLKTHPRVASSNVAQGSKATLKVWHNRLAHANYDSVKELANKGLVKGLDVAAGDDEKGVCTACVEGKMACKPFGSRTSALAQDPLALVHMDGDVTKAIQEWALEVCDDDKKRIKAIRTDGDGEFVNAELEKWMKSKVIKHDVTTPYTPEHNGAVERLNRTLVEAVRSLLQHSKLGNEWWGEASALAAWIRNRVPTKVLPGTTPFEAWTGTKPNLSRLRTFGCLCYYHVPDPLRHKLQPKARAAIYLGIVANERAWRVWDLGERRVIMSRDVVFDKDKFPTKEQPTPQLTVVLPAREEDESIEVPSQVEKEAENGGGENEESDDDVVEVPSTAAATSSTPSSLPLALTREQLIRRPNTKYTDYATVAVGELDEERAAY